MNIRHEVQAIVAKEKHVLIVLKNGVWRLPKGGIETGETPQQALSRELQEEVGLKQLSDICEIEAYSFTTPGVLHRVRVFTADTEQGDIAIDHDELEDALWTTPAKAFLELQLKEEKECMKKYIVRGVQ